ncbi:MAG: HlyC/CorC family transporter [Deltaproteobacteria bacterium]|nr:HlyC/CorC family transporter [Deltaproteobacteria bacterium]
MPEAPMYEFVGILLLLLASAFFSSAETALTALSEARIRQLQDEHPSLRKHFQRWLDRPARMMATLLVGNNIINVAASVFGARIAHRYLGSWADAAAVGIMTLLLLSFGEVAPKVFAKRAAPYWGVKVIRWVCLFDWLLRPLSLLFSGLGRATVRGAEAAGVGTEGATVTETEIEHMIDLGERDGVLEKQHGDMLRSVLEFEDTTVKEIMVPRTEMVVVSIAAPLADVLRMVNESRHSRFPVYRDRLDNVVGTLHVKDLLRHVGEVTTCQTFDWTEHVRPKPLFVPETQKISDLLREMQTRRLHLAVVVDEFGGTAGLVTLEDVLEEIVGEIQDEYDAEEPLIQEDADGHLLADARVPLWDLGQHLHTEFPEDNDYGTLGGFVTHELGRLPERGAQFEWRGYGFTVREADARRVRRVEIRRPPPAADDPDAPKSRDAR